MPTVSPLPTLRLTCVTARTIPRRVENSTVRSETSRRGRACGTPCASGSPPGIDDVAQAVAEQIEAKHRDHQRGAGKECDPPFAGDHEGCAFRHHDSPFRRGRTHAEADEGEPRG